MTNEYVKPPIWFWVVSVLALIWNLAGVVVYLAQAFATPEMMKAMPEEERMMIEQRPAWATSAFAIAVWGGLLGSLLLILRGRLAHLILVVSMIGIIVHMIYNLFIVESTMDYEPGQVIMSIMIPLTGAGLILLAKKAKAKDWLR